VDEDGPKDPMGRRRGRKKLRIDLADASSTTTEGTGLNIPTT
jgi:hypothetical protein